MPTNLALDDHMIDEARRLGKHRTKREAVNAALSEYVRRQKQKRILDLFGTVDLATDEEFASMRGKRKNW